ncbi:exocyst complex component 3-like protein 4, partial [Amblyraja radiata]|uniref:exocyst complex component 3-like protein 4 n=1 Tax=Amblyraja radiata TaxID=386614 RepID=UPI001402CB35
MPILKSGLARVSPTKLNGGPVKLLKEVVLGSTMRTATMSAGTMSAGTNPFQEEPSDALNPFAADLEQEKKNPFDEMEEGGGQGEGGPNGALPVGGELAPRRSTEKMAVLRRMLHKAKSPTEGKGGERRSFFKRRSSTEQEVPPSGPRGPEEGPTSPVSGPGADGADGHDGRKRISFLRRSRGKTEPVVETSTADVGVGNEPLSVLQILQLVKARELVLADSHIIELESECEKSGGRQSEAHTDSGRKVKDVALLYKELEAELAAIVRGSLADPGTTSHLGQLARTIEQEEKADRERDSRGREPGELRRKWRQAVKESVSERLSAAQTAGNAAIDRRLGSLGDQTVTDLIAVWKKVAVGYPREFEAFSVYVRSYHEAVASYLAQMAQQEMDIQQLYTFLEWTYCLYFREVLGHEDLTAHICKQHLGPLLPADTLQTLEDNCVSMVKVGSP